jgi:1-deoxy-D-xylulose-5-phosphate synthase
MPNLTVMAPKDEGELRQMLFTAVQLAGPTAIRYPRSAGQGVAVDQPFALMELGVAEQLRPGTDVALVAIGVMAATCLAASDLLADKGIRAGVVNARFVKPLDGEIICRLARKTGVLVTVEDNVLAGGFGSAVLEYIQTQNLHGVKVLRLGFPDVFVEQGTRGELLTAFGLDSQGIAAAVETFLAKDDRTG